jgi:hypothetical protein
MSGTSRKIEAGLIYHHKGKQYEPIFLAEIDREKSLHVYGSELSEEKSVTAKQNTQDRKNDMNDPLLKAGYDEQKLRIERLGVVGS